jgi:hypothetical protein
MRSQPDSVTDENRPQILDILQDLSHQIPRVNSPRRLALTVASGKCSSFIAAERFGMTNSNPN